MPEPLFTDIFGENATQTLETVTLVKADFADTGLTPAAANRGESLLTALVLKAATVLTPLAQETNPDQGISIEDGISSLPNRDGVNYRRNQRVINFDKVDTQIGLNPNDY